MIFNAPPEPPPADVPPLEKPKPAEKNLTVRERFAVHRERADCAACHAQLDPLGFALENFDPVGRWRNTYENGREVDTSGKLFRKHEFKNVVEFKDAILAEKNRFARAFAEHTLSTRSAARSRRRTRQPSIASPNAPWPTATACKPSCTRSCKVRRS